MITNRHHSLGLQDHDVLEMYEKMLLSRKLDERLWLLSRSGKISFAVSCQGHEGAQIGAAFALNREKDYILPYYRDLGVVLSCGMTPRDILLASFAKAEDPNSGGRQMPNHFGQRRNRIVTTSSPVTTQVPHAAGIALAAKMNEDNIVSFVTFGEGSSNQGDFHEGTNFAAVHKLPVILMCQNNRYAISVPYAKQVACAKISDRAIGYGIAGVTVDGNDPLEVFRVVKEAHARAVEGKGPTLVEVLTNRLTPHSSNDDDRPYRKEGEIEEARKNDSLNTMNRYLRELNILTAEKENMLVEKVILEIDEAVEYAENAPFALPEDALKYVYEEK